MEKVGSFGSKLFYLFVFFFDDVGFIENKGIKSSSDYYLNRYKLHFSELQGRYRLLIREASGGVDISYIMSEDKVSCVCWWWWWWWWWYAGNHRDWFDQGFLSDLGSSTQ